jgi:hypothetical protein
MISSAKGKANEVNSGNGVIDISHLSWSIKLIEKAEEKLKLLIYMNRAGKW